MIMEGTADFDSKLSSRVARSRKVDGVSLTH
jgi:hypothetical protein